MFMLCYVMFSHAYVLLCLCLLCFCFVMAFSDECERNNNILQANILENLNSELRFQINHVFAVF